MLAELVTEHPTYFGGYRLYWQSVGKTEDAEAQRHVVRANLVALREVAVDQRTESFYYAVMEGERLIDEKRRAEEWRLEALERLPKSKIAQQDLLAQAKSERDPVLACAKFAEFIEAFGDNVSWSQGAARQRFERMIAHPEVFASEDVVAASESLDRWTADFVETYGNPARHVMIRHLIARELLDVDPRQSVIYAHRGSDFVRKGRADHRGVR